MNTSAARAASEKRISDAVERARLSTRSRVRYVAMPIAKHDVSSSRPSDARTVVPLVYVTPQRHSTDGKCDAVAAASVAARASVALPPTMPLIPHGASGSPCVAPPSTIGHGRSADMPPPRVPISLVRRRVIFTRARECTPFDDVLRPRRLEELHMLPSGKALEFVSWINAASNTARKISYVVTPQERARRNALALARLDRGFFKGAMGARPPPMDASVSPSFRMRSDPNWTRSRVAILMGDTGVGKSTALRVIAGAAGIKRVVYIEADDLMPGDTLSQAITRVASTRYEQLPEGGAVDCEAPAGMRRVPPMLVVVEDLDSVVAEHAELDRARREARNATGDPFGGGDGSNDGIDHARPIGVKSAWPIAVGDLCACVGELPAHAHPIVFVSSHATTEPMRRLAEMCHTVRAYRWLASHLLAVIERAISSVPSMVADGSRRKLCARDEDVMLAIHRVVHESCGDVRAALFVLSRELHTIRRARTAAVAVAAEAVPAAAAMGCTLTQKNGQNRSAGAAVRAAIAPAHAATIGSGSPVLSLSPRADYSAHERLSDVLISGTPKDVWLDKWAIAQRLMLPPHAVWGPWSKAARNRGMGTLESHQRSWHDTVRRVPIKTEARRRCSVDAGEALAMASVDRDMVTRMVQWNAPHQLATWLRDPLPALADWADRVSEADVLDHGSWPLGIDEPQTSPALALHTWTYAARASKWLQADDAAHGKAAQRPKTWPQKVMFPERMHQRHDREQLALRCADQRDMTTRLRGNLAIEDLSIVSAIVCVGARAQSDSGHSAHAVPEAHMPHDQLERLAQLPQRFAAGGKIDARDKSTASPSRESAGMFRSHSNAFCSQSAGGGKDSARRSCRRPLMGPSTTSTSFRGASSVSRDVPPTPRDDLTVSRYIALQSATSRGTPFVPHDASPESHCPTSSSNSASLVARGMPPAPRQTLSAPTRAVPCRVSYLPHAVPNALRGTTPSPENDRQVSCPRAVPNAHASHDFLACPRSQEVLARPLKRVRRSDVTS